MAHQLANLETLIQSCLKPGYKAAVHYSNMSAHISIRFHNTINNTYQMVQISEELFHRSPQYVIDYLTTSTDCIAIAPLYQRVFDHFMREIMWSEFKKGKVWG